MSQTLQSARQLMKKRSFIAMMFLLSGLVACGINLFTINDDVAFGRQMDQEIRNTPAEYPILNNESVRGYVQGIVNRILQSPAIKYRGTFPYTVTIINDDRTINAFATPGGYIYVYTGLLRFVDNEATLAGILGHEIAHSEERHGTEHLTQAMGADVVLSIALGNNPSRLAQIAGNAAVLLGMLRNSRSDELEADNSSFTYLKTTPYFPGAIKYFFEKMEQQSGRAVTGKLEEWTSTHPTSQDRVENMNRLLRENNIPAPTPATLMADKYRTMLKQLR